MEWNGRNFLIKFISIKSSQISQCVVNQSFGLFVGTSCLKGINIIDSFWSNSWKLKLFHGINFLKFIPESIVWPQFDLALRKFDLILCGYGHMIWPDLHSTDIQSICFSEMIINWNYILYKPKEYRTWYMYTGYFSCCHTLPHIIS